MLLTAFLLSLFYKETKKNNLRSSVDYDGLLTSKGVKFFPVDKVETGF